MDYSWLPSRKGISKRDFMHWHCAQQRSVGYVYKPTVTWHQHQWFSLLSKAPLAFCKMMRTIILPNEDRKKWTKTRKKILSFQLRENSSALWKTFSTGKYFPAIFVENIFHCFCRKIFSTIFRSLERRCELLKFGHFS